MGCQDESVARVGLDEVVERGGHRSRGADEGLTARHFDDEVADREVLRLGDGSPARGGGERVAVRPYARPSPRDGVLAGDRVLGGQRPVGVVGAEVAVPQLFEQPDRGLAADLLPADQGGFLPRVGVGVAEGEGDAGQDLQLVGGTAVAGEPAFDVCVESLSGLERAVPGEDRVGRRRGELPALVGVARLEDDRPALRSARHVEMAADVELPHVVVESARIGVGEEEAGLLVGDDLVPVPGVEQLPGRRQELLGALVAVLLREIAAAPEVLAGELVPRGDDVPRGPPRREMVERGELPCHFVRFVEGGVDRPRQAQLVGDGGQGAQHGERVGSADYVQVVDLPVLLAQAQPLGQEEEVELGALGGPGEVGEGAEVDLAAGGRVAPHGAVVDAGEVGGEMDLLDGLTHDRGVLRLVRVGKSGRSAGGSGRGVAAGRA